jgi:hypothetical protein
MDLSQPIEITFAVGEEALGTLPKVTFTRREEGHYSAIVHGRCGQFTVSNIGEQSPDYETAQALYTKSYESADEKFIAAMSGPIDVAGHF